MKWITRWHVHVDRVACPWLISKFVDRGAEFVFIPWPDPLPSPDMGIPFDFPRSDFELGHHDGKCTFEAIIEKYQIEDPWVLEIAKIVHAADVASDIDTAPEAHGVELASYYFYHKIEEIFLGLCLKFAKRWDRYIRIVWIILS